MPKVNQINQEIDVNNILIVPQMGKSVKVVQSANGNGYLKDQILITVDFYENYSIRQILNHLQTEFGPGKLSSAVKLSDENTITIYTYLLD